MTAEPAPSPPIRRITAKMRLVAQTIRDGTNWGLGIIKATGMSMSATYQMLARMERAGWLECTREDKAAAAAHCRSPRKVYALTGKAADALGWHDL